MPRNSQRSKSSFVWLAGAVCGLLVACGLAVGDFLDSRHPAQADPIKRLHEPRVLSLIETPEPIVEQVGFVTCEWPEELPRPMDLPRPLDVEHLIQRQAPTAEKIAELPTGPATRR